MLGGQGRHRRRHRRRRSGRGRHVKFGGRGQPQQPVAMAVAHCGGGGWGWGGCISIVLGGRPRPACSGSSLPKQRGRLAGAGAATLAHRGPSWRAWGTPRAARCARRPPASSPQPRRSTARRCAARSEAQAAGFAAIRALLHAHAGQGNLHADACWHEHRALSSAPGQGGFDAGVPHGLAQLGDRDVANPAGCADGEHQLVERVGDLRLTPAPYKLEAGGA